MEEIPLSSWGWWSIPLFTGFYILYIPGGCSGVLNHQQYHFMYCVFGKFTSTCSASTWHRPWLLWATFKMKLEQSKSKRRHQIRNTIYTYIFMFKIEINKKKWNFSKILFQDLFDAISFTYRYCRVWDVVRHVDGPTEADGNPTTLVVFKPSAKMLPFLFSIFKPYKSPNIM